MTTYFRSNVTKGIKTGKSGIDRENKIIYGFAVISKGEAKGHDIEIDEVTLNQVVEHGNKASIGIKSRFGHPNMSSEALGTFLGRVKNFYKDGDIVRGDLHLDTTSFKTPNGDLGTYVLDLAENDPDAFGSSIVFQCKKEYRVNPDGTRMKDVNGKELMPLSRIEKLFATDIVDDPAANEGFFSESVKPSAEITAFLDKLLTRPDAVEKIVSFLNRYTMNSNEEKESNSMELKDLKIEQLKAERPDLIDQLSTEIKPAAVSDGVTQERKRITEILSDKSCQEFIQYGLRHKIDECLKTGKSKDETLFALKNEHYERLKALSVKTPGPSNAANEESSKNLTAEEKAKKDWNSNEDLRDEFSNNFDFYLAYLNGLKEDRVKVISK